MITASKYRTVSKSISLSVVALFLASSLWAQSREHYDSLAAKYKNDNAVYANITYKLVISRSSDDTGLVANSHITYEKLFLTDHSLNSNNTEECGYSDLSPLTDISGTASIPEGRGYKKVVCHNFGSASPSTYIFYDDFRVAEAMYTGLVKNSVTNTHYAMEHPDIRLLPEFFLQKNVPIANATFEVVAPDYVNLQFVLKGENTAWFSQSKEEKNGLITYRFTATDVPAYKDYPNVPSFRYIMPHIFTYITSYKLPDANRTVKVLENPDALHKYDYKYVRNVDMTVDTAITRLVKDLTKNDLTDRDKAAHLYDWVQKNVHYIAFEKGLEGFVPREADSVYKRKYGDCKDMASMLVAMCRTAGLKAYFASIGTSELPYTHKELPTQGIYNHMICAVKLGDDWVFLDATHPNLPFGANRYDIQGKEAMVNIDDKNYEIVTIPVVPASRNVTYDSTSLNIGENKVTGTANIHLQGYDAWDLGIALNDYRKKDERDKLVRKVTERGSNKYLVNKYDVFANDKDSKDVFINTDFTIGDYVQQVGKKYYVNMNLNHPFEGDRINDADRKVSYYHDYKNKITEVVTLDIPKGYRVSYLPKNAQGSARGLWNFKISYKSQAGKIMLVKEYELNTLAVNSDEFADNNKTVDALRKACKESVVLTKI